jgi:hypothetical protein
MTTEQDKLTQRARMFDECFAELSPAAQQDLKNRIEYLSSTMDKGGLLSAKELLLQLARYVDALEQAGVMTPPEITASC